MPWYRIGGIVAHVKLGGRAAKNPPAPCCAPITLDGRVVPCAAISGYACDWEVGPGQTCDRPLCDEHATQIGRNLHLCPEHLAGRRQLEPGLFDGVDEISR